MEVAKAIGLTTDSNMLQERFLLRVTGLGTKRIKCATQSRDDIKEGVPIVATRPSGTDARHTDAVTHVGMIDVKQNADHSARFDYPSDFWSFITHDKRGKRTQLGACGDAGGITNLCLGNSPDEVLVGRAKPTQQERSRILYPCLRCCPIPRAPRPHVFPDLCMHQTRIVGEVAFK